MPPGLVTSVISVGAAMAAEVRPREKNAAATDAVRPM